MKNPLHPCSSIEFELTKTKSSISFSEGSWNTAIGKGDHTGAMVPIFAYGPGSENFTGILDNTDIFFAMQEAIGINDLPDGTCY